MIKGPLSASPKAYHLNSRRSTFGVFDLPRILTRLLVSLDNDTTVLEFLQVYLTRDRESGGWSSNEWTQQDLEIMALEGG